MNACESGEEPLGEAPPLFDYGLGLISFIGDFAPAMCIAQLAERQGRALTKIRELHPRKIRPFPGDVFEAICVGCGNLWPCSTIRAIDEAGV